jgi:hypothetical protein
MFSNSCAGGGEKNSFGAISLAYQQLAQAKVTSDEQREKNGGASEIKDFGSVSFLIQTNLFDCILFDPATALNSADAEVQVLTRVGFLLSLSLPLPLSLSLSLSFLK